MSPPSAPHLLRVAGFQMPVTRNIRHHAALICAAIERAARAGAEILLTPEGSLSGYCADFNRQAARRALLQVTAHARRHRVGLALGTCAWEADGKCYNQIRFYRPDGEYLGFHAKTLLCGSLGSRPLGEINDFSPAPLRVFPWRPGIRIGGLICNDMWANPQCTPMPDSHLSQQLAARGAQVILHAVNGGRSDPKSSLLARRYHETNLRMRAEAGQVWIVTVDNSHPGKWPCSSPGGVVRPNGTWALKAPAKGPQLFFHTLQVPAPSTGRRPA